MCENEILSFSYYVSRHISDDMTKSEVYIQFKLANEQ